MSSSVTLTHDTHSLSRTHALTHAHTGEADDHGGGQDVSGGTAAGPDPRRRQVAGAVCGAQGPGRDEPHPDEVSHLVKASYIIRSIYYRMHVLNLEPTIYCVVSKIY